MTAKDLLYRLPQALDAAAAADTSAVVQYELSEPIYQVIDQGEVHTHDGRAEQPDLTVTISDDDLVALFGRRLDPMLAFMTGRLRVGGDVALAQRLVKLFDQEAVESLMS